MNRHSGLGSGTRSSRLAAQARSRRRRPSAPSRSLLLSAIHDRYWEGVGGRRPWQYWLWADLGALAISAGPLAFTGLTHLCVGARGFRDDASSRVVVWLSGAGATAVLLADASQMSRAEVERIWLPFVPWLLLSCSLLPEDWRRRGLIVQVALAVLVQHLLATGW